MESILSPIILSILLIFAGKIASVRSCNSGDPRPPEPVVEPSAADFFVAAVKSGDFETVRRLVQAGADLDKGESAVGTTPRMAAAGEGRYEIARYLLEQGASPDIKDYISSNALIYAIAKSHQRAQRDNISSEVVEPTAMARLLLKYGSNPSFILLTKSVPLVQDAEFSVLQLTVKCNFFNIFSLLIDYGADIYFKNDNGQTAASLAASLPQKVGYNFLKKLYQRDPTILT